jgi:dienelactone hydrolase
VETSSCGFQTKAATVSVGSTGLADAGVLVKVCGARTALYAFALTALWAMTDKTLSAELLIDGVPLPDGVKIAPAPNAASAPSQRFLGAWVGAWDDYLKHILIVEDVRPDGTAQVVSAIGDNPAFNITRGWVRANGTISGDTLTIASTSTYTLAAGTLTAAFQRGAIRSNARLSRMALDELIRPGTAIPWSKRAVKFLDTSLTENGKPVRLEVVLFKPEGAGPFPLLVINHGSTGRGNDPNLFKQTRWSFGLADVFTRKGWLVAFPQRRGRGNSEGLYDEGFDPDRSLGYTCEPDRSLAGADRALEDIHAAMTALRRRPDVDARRVLIGGISRGGVLSIAYAGQHRNDALGVINFVGGWVGTGCPTAAGINSTLFRRGASFTGPTVWLYGKDDVFYSVDHSRGNFAAFERAGGKGEFFEFDVPGDKNGHALNAYPELWISNIEKLMATLQAAERK